MDERTERLAEQAYAEFRRTRGPRAMAVVFDLTAGELLLLARRLTRNAATAEDLVQQTFVRAIERAEQFDPARRLLPWLTTILANEARMVARRSKPDVERVRQRAVTEPPQEAARHEAERAMDAAFAELPPTYRDVVAMRLLHDMKPRRIAAVLAIPVATVKTRLRRGVEKLAATLPPGLAFATAVSLIAGKGMAATRQAMLAHTGTAVASTAAWTLFGIVTMKKITIAIGAALVLFACLQVWWQQPPTPMATSADASSALASTVDGAVEMVTPERPAERNTVSPRAEPPPPPVAAEEVAVDLMVRAIWRQSRLPAIGVPLALLVRSAVPLAHQTTDEFGQARFALAVPAWNWPDAGAKRYLSVTTPLMPGRTQGLEVAGEPSTLEVAIEEGQRVVGLVVDGANNPVAGADVRLTFSHSPDAVVARSDAVGAFSLAGLRADFTLRASRGVMESAPATITDLTGGDGAHAGKQLVLRLDRGGDKLQIRVIAQEQPVAEATVRLDTGWRMEPPRRQLLGITNVDGIATFAGLPADTYTVEVVHRAHPPAQRRVTTEGLGATRVETVALGHSAKLVGVVRMGGKPATGISVTVGQADSLFYRAGGRTDQNGQFSADRLAVGTHELFFNGPALFLSRRATLHEGEQVLNFELPGGKSIRGRLLLSNGRPASGWKVAARRTDEMARGVHTATDAEGRFAWPDVPNRAFSLHATGPNGGGHLFFDVGTDGKEVDYQLPSTAMWQPASIIGQFQRAPPNATLSISDCNGNNRHGSGLPADGTIELNALQPGRYRLLLEHDNAVIWLTEVELASAQVLDLGAVQLPRSGALAVTLRSADGVDQKDAYVLLRSTATTGGGSFGPRPQLESDGSWRCERVPSGRWWLIVGGKGIAPDVRELFVEHDSTQRVEVELVPAVSVDVRFTAGNSGARAVGWRSLTVRRVGDRAIMLFSRGMGPLRTSLDLGPGSYTIDVATGGGFHGSAAFDVPTAAATVEVSLRRK